MRSDLKDDKSAAKARWSAILTGSQRYIVDFDVRVKKWSVYDKLKSRVYAHYDIREHADGRCVKLNEAELASGRILNRGLNKS